MKLVIVESPTKAKTISKFLGKGYSVKSSYGHVRDLPKKEMGIEIENGFNPKYVIPSKSRTRVSELKKISKKSETVILATDEDREGEAIAWHLAHILGLGARDYAGKIERIVFHEITRKAIEKALESPRQIDENLVDAQQARRVLDRLVGYELSPFLWKKIRRGLSAGRVQSVALRLIVEREREREKFKPEEYWNIAAQLETPKSKENFEAKLALENGKSLGRLGVKNKEHAQKIVAFLEKAEFKVASIAKKEVQKNPLPPYTTSTLQQDANSKLGWSAKQTMMVAQQLYEGIQLGQKEPTGLITYMRTDSQNLSMESMLAAKKMITETFGKEYALDSPRFFKTKSKGAQEAHEAIRPTFPEYDPQKIKSYLDTKQFNLYKLIWSRMLACQMAPAILDSTSVEIGATQPDFKTNYTLRASGNTIKFYGYLKIYEEHLPVSINILPKMAEAEILKLLEIKKEQKFTTPPARFSEAALIKIMEENGIGRPSTYAPTISTIIERKYVEKDENRKLFPLEIGLLVSDLLVEHFSQIVDYKFTAKMEKDLDEIADGKKEWVPVVEDFYRPFHKNLELKTKEIKKEKYQEKLDRSCPDCGGDLIIRFGRFGKFIACSNYPNCRYTEKTDTEKEIDKKIEQDEKLGACELCGAKMVIKRGKYGPFLGCSNYPNCKNIKKIEHKVGVKCPQCGVGEIIERKSKRGRVFYGCNTYPKCDYALWERPTGEICPKCQKLLVFSGKNKIKCANKECDFEKENNE